MQSWESKKHLKSELLLKFRILIQLEIILKFLKYILKYVRVDFLHKILYIC